MDFEQDPEFLAFVQANYLHPAVLERIKAELEPEYDAMVSTMNAATQLTLRKAQDDALQGVLYHENNENDELAATTRTSNNNNNKHNNQSSSDAKASAPSKESSTVNTVPKKATKKLPFLDDDGDIPTTVHDKVSKKRPSVNKDNGIPNAKSSKQRKVTTATSTTEQDDTSRAPPPLKKGQVCLTVLRTSASGKVHKGDVKIVTPLPPSDKSRKHAKVGRGAGKEIKNYGLCLAHDSEVSSLHGIAYRKKNQYFWKDNNSTNGTLAVHKNGERVMVDPDELYPLEDGMQLELGLCVVLVNFITTTTAGA